MHQPRPLVRVVLFCGRRAAPVLLAAAVLAVLCGWLAAARLSVTTDLSTLFTATLPWKQREAEQKRLFPQFDRLLVAVVDADAPEIADATAAGLQAALAADTQHVLAVRRPDALPFFEQNGLLFLDKAALGAMLDQTIDAQPFLGQLVADPSLRGLFAALSLLGMGVERGQNLTPFGAALEGFHGALQAAASGQPRPMSWQRLLAGPVAELGGALPFRAGAAAPGFRRAATRRPPPPRPCAPPRRSWSSCSPARQGCG